MVGYVNIEEQVDYDFTRARRKAFIRRMQARIFGDPTSARMSSFEDLSNGFRAFNRARLGRRVVAVEKIVGSVGRSGDFDRTFLPTRMSLEARWKRVDRAYHRGQDLPPVTLFKVGDAYFVEDGTPRKRGALPGHRVDRRRSNGPARRRIRGPGPGGRQGTDGERTGGGSAAPRGVSERPKSRLDLLEKKGTEQMITSIQNSATKGKVLALAVLLAAIASLMLAARPAHAETTFTVKNTNDSGPGSLRQAMFDANVTPGADVIDFNIDGSGVHTIAVESALPTIAEPVKINGYSQPGSHPNTKAVGSDAVLKIELSDNTQYGYGLVITGSNSTVKGVVINRWDEAGIKISGSNATGNRVVGNFIGTDHSGTQKLGNYQGIHVYDGSNNTIGGTTAAARNVISGNTSDGVYIYGTGGNKVLGNFIGTNASGTRAVRNGDSGVNIDRAPNNVVGGTQAGERNVISGNFVGVLVEGASATGNRVLGNFVGTDKNGTAPLGNYHGVIVTGASGNTIGGMAAGARNVISASQFYGVGVFGDTATGNRILSNSIFSNVELGIDLLAGGNRGRTDNDPGDIDTGPNGLQNFPLLSSAKKGAAGTTTVRGTLNSTPGKTFNIQFFSNPSGTKEGKMLLGSKSVTTDGTGNVSFDFSTKKEIRLGRNITATATGTDGTSEFSAPKKVVAR